MKKIFICCICLITICITTYVSADSSLPNLYALETVVLWETTDEESVQVGIIAQGEKVAVIESGENGWSLVMYFNLHGYVQTEMLGTYEKLSYHVTDSIYHMLQQTEVVDDNMRVLITLPKGVAVKVKEYKEDFSIVETQDIVGYVPTANLGTQQQALAGTYWTLENVRLRMTPTKESKELTIIPFGSGIVVTEYAAPGWSKVIYDDLNGYVLTEYLGTQKQLEDMKAAKEKQVLNYEHLSNGTVLTVDSDLFQVELLTWAELSDLIQIGNALQIYDLYTGVGYYVKSFYNGNHADIEPVTKVDNELLKATYGFVYSWTPRPVWVTINGRTFPASVHHMPHGGIVNTNSGMDGHICLYFPGSAAHNGNYAYGLLHQDKVDEAYQIWIKIMHGD